MIGISSRQQARIFAMFHAMAEQEPQLLRRAEALMPVYLARFPVGEPIEGTTEEAWRFMAKEVGVEPVDLKPITLPRLREVTAPVANLLIGASSVDRPLFRRGALALFALSVILLAVLYWFLGGAAYNGP